MNTILKSIRKFLGFNCKHDYQYHKVRAIDVERHEDYLITFYQCSKCGHIQPLQIIDNLRHSTCGSFRSKRGERKKERKKNKVSFTMNMTIEERAKDYALTCPPNEQTIAFTSYMFGATEQKAIDINKACEWLKKYIFTELEEGFILRGQEKVYVKLSDFKEAIED